jgi:hypothetical protein
VPEIPDEETVPDPQPAVGELLPEPVITRALEPPASDSQAIAGIEEEPENAAVAKSMPTTPARLRRGGATPI